MDSSSSILKPLITVFFIFFSATVPSSVLCNNDQYEERFNDCSSKFECGDLKAISYPFWGGSRPHFCGHQSFKLDCRDNENPVMNMTGQEFRVQSIDQSSRKMIIARDIWLNVKNFTCGAGGENNETVYYFAYDYVPVSFRPHIPVCGSTFQVPVFSTALDKLLSHESGNDQVREVLNGGFEVIYIYNSGGCEACKRSGGSCGVNSTDDSFLCYCRDEYPDPLYCLHHNSYIIKEIFYSNHLLLVAKAAVYNDDDDCPAPRHNLGLDRNSQYSSDHIDFFFFYYCSSETPKSIYPFPVNCAVNTTNHSFALFYKEGLEKMKYSLGWCQTSVDVAMEMAEDVSYTSLLDMSYVEISKMGFLLNWTANGCSNFQSSGGRCG
ncbi:hypothetical protein FNV43_RR00744 [Rhamnella rubrinervis]|uniref:non-specific serine/threonine protein kinase n=1 Tax=Rhamnella rubrinervis TaxID=2594499 RepID=A0A8K0HP77_9ROSA|nr:hypothetical protein FNV43_RR00744 [Rhamnella rubrinervis]